MDLHIHFHSRSMRICRRRRNFVLTSQEQEYLPGSELLQHHFLEHGNLSPLHAEPVRAMNRRYSSADAFRTAWNWAGKTGFFWAPLSFLCAVWVYFRLPEMKGRSYYELDVLFGEPSQVNRLQYSLLTRAERKIPARKFATTQVEPEADTHIRRDLGIVVDDLPPAAL